MVGKGENAGNQHFLLFLLCFPKASQKESVKVVIVWNCIKRRTDITVAGYHQTNFMPLYRWIGGVLFYHLSVCLKN